MPPIRLRALGIVLLVVAVLFLGGHVFLGLPLWAVWTSIPLQVAGMLMIIFGRYRLR